MNAEEALVLVVARAREKPAGVTFTTPDLMKAEPAIEGVYPNDVGTLFAKFHRNDGFNPRNLSRLDNNSANLARYRFDD